MITTALVALVVLLALRAVQAAPRRLAADGRTTSVPRRHEGGRASELVDLVDRTSRDVRTGVALRTALGDALRHHRSLFPTMSRQLDRGMPLPDALDDASATPTGDELFVVHGLQLAAHTGGAVADTLDRVTAIVRERQVWRAERHAQAAQARALSARMLTVLPLLVAGWGAVSGPRVREAYVDSPATGALAALGIALNIVGWRWMRHLVRGPGVR